MNRSKPKFFKEIYVCAFYLIILLLPIFCFSSCAKIKVAKIDSLLDHFRENGLSVEEVHEKVKLSKTQQIVLIRRKLKVSESLGNNPLLESKTCVVEGIKVWIRRFESKEKAKEAYQRALDREGRKEQLALIRDTIYYETDNFLNGHFTLQIPYYEEIKELGRYRREVIELPAFSIIMIKEAFFQFEYKDTTASQDIR